MPMISNGFSDQTKSPRFFGPEGIVGFFLVVYSFVILNFSQLENPNMQLNTVLFASVAVSHLRLGLGFTKGQDFNTGVGSLTLLRGRPTMDDQRVLLEEPGLARHIGILDASNFAQWLEPALDWEKYIAPYLHHPPGIGLLIALIYRLTGYGLTISSINAISALMHFGSLLIFMAILWRYERCVRLCILAGWIFTVVPISAIYGRQISYEITTLFFTFVTLGIFLLIQESAPSVKSRHLLLLGIAAFVNCFTDWSALFFLFSLWCLEWIRHRRVTPVIGILSGAVALGVLAIVGQLWAAAGGSFDRIIYGFNTKTSDIFKYYSPLKLGGHLLYQHMLLGFTIPVVVLSATGLGLFALRIAGSTGVEFKTNRGCNFLGVNDRLKNLFSPGQLWILAYSATAALYCGVFIKGAADLIYWHMFFLPVEAYLSAKVLQLIWRKWASRGRFLFWLRVPVLLGTLAAIYFNSMGYACYDFYQPQKYSYRLWEKTYINSFNVRVWQGLKQIRRRS